MNELDECEHVILTILCPLFKTLLYTTRTTHSGDEKKRKKR